jgi:hypothetical protein
MRPSPNCLVVSRSEGRDEPMEGRPTDDQVSRNSRDHDRSWNPFRGSRLGSRDDSPSDYSEVDLRIKISYKTLVFAFVTFDVIRKVVDAITS